MKNEHEKFNYVEFPTPDLSATKRFFESALDWKFEDFGPEYTSFSDEGLNGGFFRSDHCSKSENGGALLVFYSADLESTQKKVEAAGGKIVKEVFSFPGGRRFHFEEPAGNEFAVWSDKDA